MTTPEEPAPKKEEESSEFNLADYEIEEEEGEEKRPAEEPEKSEESSEKESPSLEEVRAMLRQSAKEAKKAESSAPPPLQEAPLEKVDAEELQLTLSVEAGSIRIPYDQLLSLKAGSLLEIGLSPEQGVNLMVEGQLIGKGELVKIGDAIGVRILDI